jgi:hypothetical protein
VLDQVSSPFVWPESPIRRPTPAGADSALRRSVGSRLFAFVKNLRGWKLMALRTQQVELPNTERHLLSSNIVGDQFKIDIALPRNYADTTENYPVVYLLA